jgi:hypothetical protein
MSFYLVVVRPFGTYVKGDVISDAASIAEVASSDKASWVVRVITPAAWAHLDQAA